MQWQLPVICVDSGCERVSMSTSLCVCVGVGVFVQLWWPWPQLCCILWGTFPCRLTALAQPLCAHGIKLQMMSCPRERAGTTQCRLTAGLLLCGQPTEVETDANGSREWVYIHVVISTCVRVCAWQHEKQNMPLMLYTAHSHRQTEAHEQLTLANCTGKFAKCSHNHFAHFILLA